MLPIVFSDASAAATCAAVTAAAFRTLLVACEQQLQEAVLPSVTFGVRTPAPYTCGQLIQIDSTYSTIACQGKTSVNVAAI
eukprot:12901-Heterococcus_DN1.PRE.2